MTPPLKLTMFPLGAVNDIPSKLTMFPLGSVNYIPLNTYNLSIRSS